MHHPGTAGRAGNRCTGLLQAWHIAEIPGLLYSSGTPTARRALRVFIRMTHLPQQTPSKGQTEEVLCLAPAPPPQALTRRAPRTTVSREHYSRLLTDRQATSTCPPRTEGLVPAGALPGHRRVSRPPAWGSSFSGPETQRFITQAKAASLPPGSLGANA